MSDPSLAGVSRAAAPPSDLAPARLPLVSVIMPVRNEAGYIDRALEAVFTQDYPGEKMEVVVADGMSTDGTREILEAWRERHPRLRVVDNPGRIAPTALNAAMAEARGEIVIRVDGHCEIAQDYVSRCVRHLLADAGEAVGGPVTTVGENRLGEAIAVAMSSPFGVGNALFRTVQDQTLLVDTVAFPAYTRAWMERLGPFDEELVRNQDDEYNYRLRKRGGRVLLAADVRSRYYSRGSWKRLWKQYFEYGHWKVRVLQKHPRQMRSRQFVPAAFVAALLLSLLLAPVSLFGRWALLAIVGSYGAANLTASVLAARRRGPGLLPLLPPAFVALHLAYGSGFLIGLARFRGRWAESLSRGAAPRAPETPRSASSPKC